MFVEEQDLSRAFQNQMTLEECEHMVDIDRLPVSQSSPSMPIVSVPKAKRAASIDLGPGLGISPSNAAEALFGYSSLSENSLSLSTDTYSTNSLPLSHMPQSVVAGKDSLLHAFSSHNDPLGWRSPAVDELLQPLSASTTPQPLLQPQGQPYSSSSVFFSQNDIDNDNDDVLGVSAAISRWPFVDNSVTATALPLRATSALGVPSSLSLLHGHQHTHTQSSANAMSATVAIGQSITRPLSTPLFATHTSHNTHTQHHTHGSLSLAAPAQREREIEEWLALQQRLQSNASHNALSQHHLHTHNHHTQHHHTRLTTPSHNAHTHHNLHHSHTMPSHSLNNNLFPLSLTHSQTSVHRALSHSLSHNTHNAHHKQDSRPVGPNINVWTPQRTVFGAEGRLSSPSHHSVFEHNRRSRPNSTTPTSFSSSRHHHTTFSHTHSTSSPCPPSPSLSAALQGLDEHAIESLVVLRCEQILRDAAEHALKAVELANTLRARVGTEVMAVVRERWGGLLALLEKHSERFAVERIPKNDRVALKREILALRDEREGEGEGEEDALTEREKEKETAESETIHSDPQLDPDSSNFTPFAGLLGVPEGQEPTRCLHVSSVPPGWSESQLALEFDRFGGGVDGVKVISQKQRRFAFVSFATVAQAAAAKTHLSRSLAWKGVISFARGDPQQAQRSGLSGAMLGFNAREQTVLTRLCDDTYVPTQPWAADAEADLPFCRAVLEQIAQFGGNTTISKLRGFLKHRVGTVDNIKSVPLKAMLNAYPSLFRVDGNLVALLSSPH